MAEAQPGKTNFLSDVLLPIVAFVSASSGPSGAAAASALTGALGVGQRRREGERREGRQDTLLNQRQQDLDLRQQREAQRAQLERPKQELESAQAQFQLGNLLDINEQIGASVPSAAATQALGGPQTERLQAALGRGEQAPLPQEAPSPQVRQQRLGGLATSPAGRAQLESAGLSKVAASGTVGDVQAAQARSKLIDVKQKALEDLRGYTPDLIPPEQREAVGQGIARAQSAEELLSIVANLPPGTLKPKSGRIEEYKFDAQQKRAAGLPVGTLEDFILRQKRNSASRVVTNVGPSGVNYGDPPKDTVWARNSDGSVALQPQGPQGELIPTAIPIRGGAAYRDIEEAAEKKQLSRKLALQSAGVVVDNLNRGLAIIEDSILPTTGLIGSALAFSGGTGANDLAEKLAPVKSRIQIDQLQLIRAASETGGALGNVSDAEGRLLQSAFGSLQQSQSKEELIYNMNRVREIFLDTLYGVERPDRNLNYLNQKDIAELNKAQEESREKQRAFYEGRGTAADLNPAQLSPNDLSNMTEDQLNALEQRLQGGSQ